MPGQKIDVSALEIIDEVPWWAALVGCIGGLHVRRPDGRGVGMVGLQSAIDTVKVFTVLMILSNCGW